MYPTNSIQYVWQILLTLDQYIAGIGSCCNARSSNRPRIDDIESNFFEETISGQIVRCKIPLPLWYRENARLV
jgi:hypothetical protein